MKLTIIGTSHGAPENNRICTAMLLEAGDNYYVIDTGSSVEDYMVKSGLDIEKIKAVFISHMHEDHVGKIFGLLKMMITYHGDMRASVFLPEEGSCEALKAWHSAMHGRIPENRISLNTTREGMTLYDDGTIKVSAVKTDHIKGFDTFAYVIEGEGKRVVLTGDLCDDLHDYPETILTEPCDAVITELCHYRKPFGFVPGSIEKLMQSKTKKIIFGHIYPGGDDDMEKIRNTFPFETAIASDGDTFVI